MINGTLDRMAKRLAHNEQKQKEEFAWRKLIESNFKKSRRIEKELGLPEGAEEEIKAPNWDAYKEALARQKAKEDAEWNRIIEEYKI